MLNINLDAFRICNILTLKFLLQLVSLFISIFLVLDYCQSLCRLRKGKNSGMFGTKLNSLCDAYCSLLVQTFKRIHAEYREQMLFNTPSLIWQFLGWCRKQASLTERFRGFSQYVQENDGMVPQTMWQSLPPSCFPVH
jgi:hypothetical protein